MDREGVKKIIDENGVGKEFLIPIITAVQNNSKYHYISQKEARLISEEMGIRESEVYETISFFSAFSETPQGEHIIKVCDSTVCRLNDNAELIKLLEYQLSIKMGETTRDKKFTLMYAPCFGACDISPAIKINDQVYGNITRGILEEILEIYREDCHEENS
jgi:NADH-quinone oxidoreductase subunit E